MIISTSRHKQAMSRQIGHDMTTTTTGTALADALRGVTPTGRTLDLLPDGATALNLTVPCDHCGAPVPIERAITVRTIWESPTVPTYDPWATPTAPPRRRVTCTAPTCIVWATGRRLGTTGEGADGCIGELDDVPTDNDILRLIDTRVTVPVHRVSVGAILDAHSHRTAHEDTGELIPDPVHGATWALGDIVPSYDPPRHTVGRPTGTTVTPVGADGARHHDVGEDHHGTVGVPVGRTVGDHGVIPVWGAPSPGCVELVHTDHDGTRWADDGVPATVDTVDHAPGWGRRVTALADGLTGGTLWTPWSHTAPGITVRPHGTPELVLDTRGTGAHPWVVVAWAPGRGAVYGRRWIIAVSREDAVTAARADGLKGADVAAYDTRARTGRYAHGGRLTTTAPGADSIESGQYAWWEAFQAPIVPRTRGTASAPGAQVVSTQGTVADADARRKAQRRVAARRRRGAVTAD